MSLLDQIQADLKQAMIAKDAVRVSVLRLLRSEIKNYEIKNGHAVNEDEITKLIRKEIKKREETAEIYTSQGQKERADIELLEASHLSPYLPAALSQEEIDATVQSVLTELSPLDPTKRGTAIKTSMERLGSGADGKTVSEAVGRLWAQASSK